MEQFAHQAPTLIVALSSPVENSKIPLWEQELSAGAACMNLLHAATALGFGGGWLTGWPSYNTIVRDAFGKQHEKIAGFLFLGTPSRSLEERPRPDYDDRVSARSDEHTSELQSLMRISYAVFCLKKQKATKNNKL